ncbi:MAG: adenosylmethionine decarboxylase [Rhizobiales bacterium]|nr:adenosylmethionine decarboxylase [Hyphomicrobiales bacterium]
MSKHSLAQIGVDAEAEAVDARADAQIQTGEFNADANDDRTNAGIAGDGPKDYFIERNGLRYAGSHLILDLWDAEHLDDAEVIEMAFRRAIREAGATLLHMHFHEFSDNGGISGVAVLAESHMSIHTWPERAYAAIDIFMCGAAKPHKTVPILKHAFKAGRISLSEQMRGVA